MLDDAISLNPQVVDTTLDDGEVVLLHLDSKMYYSLNPTGERIWRGLKNKLSLRQISLQLQDEFDVEKEDADRSVLELVDELCEQRLALRNSRNA